MQFGKATTATKHWSFPFEMNSSEQRECRRSSHLEQVWLGWGVNGAHSVIFQHFKQAFLHSLSRLQMP